MLQGETRHPHPSPNPSPNVLQGETRTEKRLKEKAHKARMEAEMTEYNEQLKRDEEAAQAALTGVLAGGGSRPGSARHGIATPGSRGGARQPL